ncbi:MAG TPA: hypothetical protein VHU41_20735 [Thermoanaerobaculia bacterium]|nr:hypothetical protein [Thermoanaerobaculia bacterium]
MKRSTGVQTRVAWTGIAASDPWRCQIWLKVQSDSEQDRIESESGLIVEIQAVVISHGYPAHARDSIQVRVASEETVERVADGNWYVFLNK